MKAFQFVLIGVLAFVDAIKCFFTPIECDKCKLYAALLESEQEKREYYEKLLLTRAGIIRDEDEITADVTQYPSMRKAVTLSTMRKIAARISLDSNAKRKEASDKFEGSLKEHN